MNSILNIAAYKFLPLDDLENRRNTLRHQCQRHGLKGTILLSPEGINCFLAAPPANVRQWIDHVAEDSAFADLHIKESYSESVPFKRMLVKIKREIIAFGVDGIDPHRRTSPKLKPAELKRWLDEGREVALLDVRNDFEVRVGTFTGAIPVGIGHFRDFERALAGLPDSLRHRPVVMFCTGGIRCEKAGPLMQRNGFDEVYQLDGGILQYFEDCGGAHYRGDCFVFDQRVAVDSQLNQTGLAQCYACQSIVSAEDQQSEQYVVGRSCPACFEPPELQRIRSITRRQSAITALAADLPGSQPHIQQRPIRIPQRMDGQPLIDCIGQLLPQIPRDQWEMAFGESRILYGRVAARPARRVRSGEQYMHLVPGFVEPAVNARIDLLWEDDAVVIINKPAPLPVHACGRFNHNTLLGLMNRVYRPEVLRAAHRLDANTSGVMVLCRRRSVARVVQRQFENREVSKEYVVRCAGHPPRDRFSCEISIGLQAGAGRIRIGDPVGDDALTDFVVLERFADGTSLLRAVPISGRTNQIRAHLWELGFPVIGDPLYLENHQLGKNETLDCDAAAMCLHSRRLEFTHPATGQRMTVEAAPPAWAR